MATVTTPPVDIVLAENYSLSMLPTRKQLIGYLRCAHQSLGADGMLALSLAGGPGFTTPHTEVNDCRLGSLAFRYEWEVRSWDPNTQTGEWAVHFEIEDGHRIPRAFEYRWRLWSIDEVRTALHEAGFAHSLLYWEQLDETDAGTGEFELYDEPAPDWSWNAYVMGLR